MTAEQVDQWKRERDIAYHTKDENAINAVEQHRVEMLMDCQMKTATRVKDLIKSQTDIILSINTLNAKMEKNDSKLNNMEIHSQQMNKQLETHLNSLQRSFDNQISKTRIREAQWQGGIFASKWFFRIIGILISSGVGACLLKLWQMSQAS